MILLTKLFQFLGVRGIIIILLLAVVGAEGWIIKSQRTKIEDQAAAIVKLESQIGLQNDSIQKSGEAAAKLQESLNVSEMQRKAISDEYKKYRAKVWVSPAPKTCPDAVSELKSVTSDLNKKWNEKK